MRPSISRNIAKHDQSSINVNSSSRPNVQSKSCNATSMKVTTRREHLTAVIPLLSTAIITPSTLKPFPAHAADTTELSTAATALLPSPEYKSFIERDFLVRYPPTIFKVVEADFSQSTPGPRKQSPIRVEIVPKQEGSTARISVVQQQAAKLKQTLLQITDISLLGSIEEVAKLLLPPGSKVLGANIVLFPQPPRDTGTVLGVIERPPVQIYHYEVLLSNGQHAYVAVGALLGRILLLGASASEEEWDSIKESLKGISDSFKLLPK